jgi:hypothetical protein
MLFSLWLEKEGDPIRLIGDESLKLLRLPQRQQLKALELPMEQKWVKLLRKIPIQEVKYLNLPLFQMLTRPPNRKFVSFLQHSQQISAYEIWATSTVTSIQYIQKQLGDVALREVLPLQLNALRRLPKPTNCKLPQFVTKPLEDAEKLLTGEIRPREHLKYKDWRSKWPFVCPHGWEHLDTFEKVRQEGREQSNCLKLPICYLNEDTFLFRITKPVRATACVKKETSGSYSLFRCLGARNTQLDWEHELKIRAALKEVLSCTR